MHIACSTDNNYIMPTGIMICSLCENNKDAQITFHILSSDINEQNKKKLEDIVDKYNQHILFHHIDDKDFADFPINQPGQSAHIHSMATYYRLLLHEILPPEIQKIIYLDGDIIVRHSLRKLWETDIEHYALAAVPDIQNNKMYNYNRLEYPSSLGYFNAGVLLINLKYWREHQVKTAFYDYARKYPERLQCHDQDILNYVFRNEKLVLNVTYNFQQNFLYKKEYRTFSDEIEKQIENCRNNPVIIHYIASPKPWFKDCTHPYKDEFEKYRLLTEWSVYEETYSAPLRERLKLAVKEVLVKLHLYDASHVMSAQYGDTRLES